jgi:hypothetical protein
MKNFFLILSFTMLIIISAFNVKSQDIKEYTLEGKLVEMYDQIGPEFRYYDTKREDVALYFNVSEKAFILFNNIAVVGIYDVMFYTKKNKEINKDKVAKMLKKNKVDHYIFQSIQTTNGNIYTIYLPFNLSYVKYLETENGRNYMYYFKVTDTYNGPPKIFNKIKSKYER